MGREQWDHRPLVINLGKVTENLNPQARGNFSQWLRGQQAALYRAVPVDPYPSPAAGTGELLASAVRVALLTLWVQTVMQQGAGNFAL